MELTKYGITFEIHKQLENDLIALIKGVQENVSYIDCLQDEVHNDVNAACASDMMSKHHADFILNNFVYSTRGIR